MNALPSALWLPLICDLVLSDASDVPVVPDTACGQMQRALGSMALSLISHCQDGLTADQPVLHWFLQYQEHGENCTERGGSARLPAALLEWR
jgi:hypothetical protein